MIKFADITIKGIADIKEDADTLILKKFEQSMWEKGNVAIINAGKDILANVSGQRKSLFVEEKIVLTFMLLLQAISVLNVKAV